MWLSPSTLGSAGTAHQVYRVLVATSSRHGLVYADTDGLVITSAANPRLKLVRRLASRRARQQLGLFVCEGEDLVAAALEAGIDPVEALVDAERPVLAGELAGAEAVEPRLLQEVSVLGHGPRVIAVFRRSDLPGADAPGGLALWRVGDPGNLGTLMRVADALGPASLWLSEGCADPTGPKAVRASAGALFRVGVGRFDEAPAPWLGLVARDGEPIDRAELPVAATLLLGAEREGLPDDLLARCERRLTIPQTGDAESLNVAMAGSIALWERRRRSG